VSAPQFSIGEWVERVFDGKVGVVKRIQPYDGDFAFYVDLDPTRRVKACDEELWAGTTPAWRRHYRWHAHVTEESRDCDGRYSGGHVDEMTLEERCDQFGDLHFKERVAMNVVSLHGHGELTVTPSGLSWHEQTDEGYRAATVRWCEEECSDERSWQRDHRAESMGY